MQNKSCGGCNLLREACRPAHAAKRPDAAQHDQFVFRHRGSNTFKNDASPTFRHELSISGTLTTTKA
ncbi:unnamed protein product, partial [Brenthis ino]